MFMQLPIDKYARILEDTNTLIGLPPIWPVSAPPPPPKEVFKARPDWTALFFCPLRRARVSDVP
jgi:hypothetical protein